MRKNQRFEDYRRRRHHAAQRRRGRSPSVRPGGCPPRVRGNAARELREARLRGRPDSTVVLDFAQRFSLFAGVVGVLERRRSGVAEILAVAPTPWTAAIRLVAETWLESVEKASSPVVVRFRVEASPPPDLSDYRCLFWRQA